jgi:hypothetical protein
MLFIRLPRLLKKSTKKLEKSVDKPVVKWYNITHPRKTAGVKKKNKKAVDKHVNIW